MVYRLLDGPRARRLVIHTMKIITQITINLALFLTCCLNCLWAGDARGKPGARIVLKEVPTAEALEQKLLEMSAAGKRVFGVETEFGCLVDDESAGGYETVVEAVKDHVFHEQRLGAIDRHPRDGNALAGQ